MCGIVRMRMHECVRPRVPVGVRVCSFPYNAHNVGEHLHYVLIFEVTALNIARNDRKLSSSPRAENPRSRFFRARELRRLFGRS